MNLGGGCVLAVLLLTLNDALYHVWSCFPEIAQVIASYTATGPEQLTLAPGQLILIRKKNPGGWWEGELQVSVFSICLKIPCLDFSMQDFEGMLFHGKVQIPPHCLNPAFV